VKKAIAYIVIGALFSVLLYVTITQARKLNQAHSNASRDDVLIETLTIENEHLQKLSDSLFDKTVLLDTEMNELERKADSLGKVATLPMPCEHELELKREEVKLVRGALAKCKEAKSIQTTRLGLCEMQIENHVVINETVMRVSSTQLKQEKRKSFFRGVGAGGLLVGILIIIAL
jgi:hypothetical protein